MFMTPLSAVAILKTVDSEDPKGEETMRGLFKGFAVTTATVAAAAALVTPASAGESRQPVTSATAVTTEVEPTSIRGIPPHCTPASDRNAFWVTCNTQRTYHAKAWCDHADGRKQTLRGADVSNGGYSAVHCNTLGRGWHYRDGSGIVLGA
ncbi:hypothetical protein [Streptomyces sp. C36]|uniref:hypothetical protein n=1 Tax=Streptomyces sp. C36 TaxID=3237122 RepID=UPI0034C6CF6F